MSTIKGKVDVNTGVILLHLYPTLQYISQGAANKKHEFSAWVIYMSAYKHTEHNNIDWHSIIY